MDRIKMIKEAQAKRQGLTLEQLEMQEMIAQLDARKKQNKIDARARAKAKKAAKKEIGKERVRSASLDINLEQNLHHNDVQRFIEDSSIMDAYNEAKNDWD